MPGSATAGEPFERRVRAIKESWQERRQVKLFAGAHDAGSQAQLLLAMHGWACSAREDIVRVYGGAIDVRISPFPLEAAEQAFTITVDERFSATFALVERSRNGLAAWHLEVSIAFAENGRHAVAAGPERRNGHWTRSRLEDVVLSLIGAYERQRGDSVEALPGLSGTG